MRRLPKDITPEHKAMLETVAANVQRLRELRGWTQVEAARRCGLSKVTYQYVEAGETCFTSTSLSGLCDGFGVEVRELFVPAAAPVKRSVGRPKKALAVEEQPAIYEMQPQQPMLRAAERKSTYRKSPKRSGKRGGSS